MIVFSLRGVRVSVGFGFLAVLALFSAINTPRSIAASILAIILHESAHIVAMTVLGVRLQSAEFHALGVRICPVSCLMSYGKEIAVMLSGPAVNIIAGLIFYYNGNLSHAYPQLCLGLMNLLPCTKLDGGCALRCALAMTKYHRGADRLCDVISWVTVVLVLIVAVFFS